MGHKNSPSFGRWKKKPLNQNGGLRMIKNQQQVSEQKDRDLNSVIKIDQGQIKSHLGEMVRQSVQETLNSMLDAEADQLCKAHLYERSEARTNSRAGHYTRGLETKTGPNSVTACWNQPLMFINVIKLYQYHEVVP
jgi:hypothetical protein